MRGRIWLRSPIKPESLFLSIQIHLDVDLCATRCYPANAIESIHFWFDRVRLLRCARDRLHRGSSVHLIEVRAELISKILGVQLNPHDPGEARPWGKDADRAAGAPPVGDPHRRLRDHAIRAPAAPRRRHLHRRRV